ncbi:hypothetical protein [Streptomyces sp. NPDC012888]|uniref:hypothetical protein n=1 Tax=Streptomyces sp. NPDC012888 TaxID=3364855 RepID=UPI0036C16482
MAHIAGPGRKAFAFNAHQPASGKRHPLVAAAMVIPLATLLVVLFGGWEQVVTQASSVGALLGR